MSGPVRIGRDELDDYLRKIMVEMPDKTCIPFLDYMFVKLLRHKVEGLQLALAVAEPVFLGGSENEYARGMEAALAITRDSLSVLIAAAEKSIAAHLKGIGAKEDSLF